MLLLALNKGIGNFTITELEIMQLSIIWNDNLKKNIQDCKYEAEAYKNMKNMMATFEVITDERV